MWELLESEGVNFGQRLYYVQGVMEEADRQLLQG